MVLIALISLCAALTHLGKDHIFLSFSLSLFCLFKAAPTAYGGSQARGLNRAVAAGLCHSYSNARSEPH